MRNFLLGLGAGIGLGLVVAPDKGKHSRRELRRVAGELMDRAPEALRGAFDEVVDRVPAQLRDVSERLPEPLRDAAEQIQPQLGKVIAMAGHAHPDQAEAQQGAETRRASGSTAERLNRATREDLLAVYGIGPVLADRIMHGRPYRSARELLDRGILNEQLYDNLKRELLDRAA